MQYTHIFGIDIAKKTIDVALCQNKANDPIITHKFTNNTKGYQTMLAWIKKHGAQIDQLLICLENTGIYHRNSVKFLQKHQAFVWVENAATIKWSGGLQRGKTDKKDAQRICLYAFRNQDKARTFSAKDEELEQIADLKTQREGLIQARVSLEAPIKEKREAGLEKEASSGSSIRGKTKVHSMANKTLKTSLHMCALSSIRNNATMKEYYQRKVKQGKNKMCVINAIRNKLLITVFACVRDGKVYEYNHVYKQVA